MLTGGRLLWAAFIMQRTTRWSISGNREELKHVTYVERKHFHNVLHLKLNVAIPSWEDEMR